MARVVRAARVGRVSRVARVVRVGKVARETHKGNGNLRYNEQNNDCAGSL